MAEPQDTPTAGETTFVDAEAPAAAPASGEGAPPAGGSAGPATDAGTPPAPAAAPGGAEAEAGPAPDAGAEAPPSDADVEPAAAEAAEAPAVAGTAVPGDDATAVLQRERDQYLALAQRTQADFENYRRRMARENAAALDKGVARLATELLGALDHLELALRAAAAEGGTLYDGVRMVQQELVAGLKRAGIQPYDPKGEPFDPNEHEAMVQQPVEGVASGVVVETYQQGYRINGSVLRPARVVVAA